MQKDTWINTIYSVSLNPEGRNVAQQVIVDSVVVNGETWPGYLDIGLHDTMKDLFVNFVGAVIFSVIGALYIMGRGKGWFAKKFIPRLKVDELPAPLGGARPAGTPPLRRGRGAGASHPSSQHCPFCRIAQGEAPCYRIYEDEYTLAFLDTAGDVEGHTLVIPQGPCGDHRPLPGGDRPAIGGHCAAGL